VKLLRHDLHTLTGAYALDAIDGTERERFEHHLNRCQSCGQEVRGLQETATRLALAVARVPPPGLKAAVLAGAARTRQHPPLADTRPAAEPRVTRRPRLAMAFAAAATVLVVVLAVALVLQRRQLDTARAQQHQVAAVLAAPDARILAGRTSVGGTATVVASRRLHELVFTSAGLPVLASSKVYQLWLIGPSGATSAGLLPEASQGRTEPVLASGLVPGDVVGVTVEPAGGTRQPTTKPIVLIKVAS
jgi:anti-sigma-K factor RskA